MKYTYLTKTELLYVCNEIHDVPHYRMYNYRPIAMYIGQQCFGITNLQHIYYVTQVAQIKIRPSIFRLPNQKSSSQA